MAYLLSAIHPASILHGGRPIPEVIAADLGKAFEISKHGVTHEEYIDYIIPGNPMGIQVAFETGMRWMQEWRRRGARIGVDVETSALDYFNCKLYSIALGEAETKIALSFTLCDLHTLPPSWEIALTTELAAVLADENISKVCHNAPFDLAVLGRKGYQVRGRIWDTQGMHHLIQPDIPHDLGWIGQTYLQVGPWKLDHESGKMANTKDPISLLIYNARDALYTAMLVEPLLHDIEARGMSASLAHWQAEYALLATEMELAGLPINFEKRKAMGQELIGKANVALKWMRDFLGLPEFNPMADGQRREILFGRKFAGPPWNLGLNPSRYTKKKGLASTGYRSIIDYLEHPFVRHLANYVESRMIYATLYRDGTQRNEKGKLEEPGAYQRAICSDGRLHPQWKPNTLHSSRWGSSPNVQNLRVFDREFFEAPPGRVFIGADKNQAELRVIAGLAGEEALLAEMRRPDGDPHRLAAIRVYGEAFLQKTLEEQKLLRTIVKNVCYASLYLAGVEVVWRTVRERKQLDSAIRATMTLPVVRHVHASYFMAFTKIQQLHENNIRKANTEGYVEIPPLGRRRWFPIRPIPATDLANWVGQCCSADYVTTEMCAITAVLKERFKDAHQVIHGHDQLVIEAREQDAEAIKELVNEMFGHSKVVGPAGIVELSTEAHIGKTLRSVK